MIQTSAPAKVILFGEHAVVYNAPAIAIPISSLRARASYEKSDAPFSIIASNLQNDGVALSADMRNQENPLTLLASLILERFDSLAPSGTILLSSDIPIASGLGSGAAVSAALGRALAGAIGAEISDEILNNIVYEGEKIHHGTPSGIDNTVIVYEQAIYFVRNKPIERLTIKTPFTIVIGDTGRSSLTHEAVGDVKKLYDANPRDIRSIFDEIAEISTTARHNIEQGKIELLGDLMQENHRLLQRLTVSSDELDCLVNSALKAGALGAKLSGGGRGGNMIALVEPAHTKAVEEALIDAGAKRTFNTEVG